MPPLRRTPWIGGLSRNIAGPVAVFRNAPGLIKVLSNASGLINALLDAAGFVPTPRPAAGPVTAPRHPARLAMALVLFLSPIGCADSATAPGDFSAISLHAGTYFVAQPRKPDAVMEALFLGQVVEDGEGCLRLQSPANHTVVWPYRSTLDVRGDGSWVVSEEGKDIGKIGGAFRFGGGEVPFLHEGFGFTDGQITEIRARCPGRYWIVGEVYTP